MIRVARHAIMLEKKRLLFSTLTVGLLLTFTVSSISTLTVHHDFFHVTNRSCFTVALCYLTFHLTSHSILPSHKDVADYSFSSHRLRERARSSFNSAVNRRRGFGCHVQHLGTRVAVASSLPRRIVSRAVLGLGSRAPRDGDPRTDNCGCSLELVHVLDQRAQDALRAGEGANQRAGAGSGELMMEVETQYF
jgi:hypothetical protein